MHRYTLLVFVGLSWVALASNAVAQVPNVAVVGAGLGGAFTAARIAELAPPDLQPEIDIFEAAEQEGGRLQEFTFEGEALELGASIFWDHNMYVKTAAQRLGLRLRQLGGRGRGRQDVESASRPSSGEQQQQQHAEEQEEQEEQQQAGPSGKRQPQSQPAPPRGFTVWNGSAFVVNMTGTWSDKLVAALRYGTSALRYNWLVRDAFRRFRRVYDMQAAGTAWETPEQLLRSLELYNETQQSCSDYMRSWLQQPAWWLWGGAEFADEVAGAANRCNYNQNNEQMNAFAGLVSYMPAAYGAIWQIEGGNRQLVSGLLAASGGRLVAHARVTAVRRRPEDGRYCLEVEVEGRAVEVFGPYDAVVVAAPLRGHEIQFDLGDPTPGYGSRSESPRGGSGGDAAVDPTAAAATIANAAAAASGGSETIVPQPYQVTVTTYVAAGNLRPGYFNVERVPPVERVFVTSGAEAPFSSLAVALPRPAGRSELIGPDAGGGRRVYKIFSPEELPGELLEALFEAAPEPPRVLSIRRWYAYPRFQPPERFSPFQLAPGLVYGNALEPAASAMEIAAIEAHNSALLVSRHLKGLAASRAREEEEKGEEEVEEGAVAAAAA